MFTRSHSKADPNYINIGDTSLIQQRNDYPVRLAGYGSLGEYIPFYFGTLSPMLLNIKTGHRGITKRRQSDIVYICCKLDCLVSNCPQWCFTDGHAKHAITAFYDDVNDLEKVDWTLVDERYWKNTGDDFDRMRRKQAEFLVKNYVPASCIQVIVVYNEEVHAKVQHIIDEMQLEIKVKINPKNRFYY